MKLTRRDALLALGGFTASAAAIGSARRGDSVPPDEPGTVRRMHAVAEVIYPSEIDIEESFIRTFVRGRLEGREDYRTAQAQTLADLDGEAIGIAGQGFAHLSRNHRETVLSNMGVLRAAPAPDGTVEERVRFYVVNDLLYALFRTPVGARAVGLENPPGYPGGVEAYQRGVEE